ncbi:MAG: rod shape-determining protein MreC [Solirubrobacterales bacterium]|nr:rod shape-determining protein MreC [Solirubrobacterales bacterium]
MYDKTVRRRRAVLGLLVACSLILLTAYFGESAGGALHGVQRGASEVLNPVQDGASRALKPVRDLFGWFGDTLEAKGDVEDLRAERNSLRRELLAEEGARVEADRLRKMLELDSALDLERYEPVTGRVIAQSPTVWYATIRVNKGSDDGVRRGQPVINEEALIGEVTEVFSGAAQVTLITDTTSKVTARTSRRGSFGVVEPASAGNPTDLILNFAPSSVNLDEGERVVTRGTVTDTDRLQSLFPAGLPVGEITRIENAGTDTQEVHLRPFANMRNLDVVQILTRPGAGT